MLQVVNAQIPHVTAVGQPPRLIGQDLMRPTYSAFWRERRSAYGDLRSRSCCPCLKDYLTAPCRVVNYVFV